MRKRCTAPRVPHFPERHVLGLQALFGSEASCRRSYAGLDNSVASASSVEMSEIEFERERKLVFPDYVEPAIIEEANLSCLFSDFCRDDVRHQKQAMRCRSMLCETSKVTKVFLCFAFALVCMLFSGTCCKRVGESLGLDSRPTT